MRNIFLFSVILIVYGLQFYYNIMYSYRFVKHLQQVIQNLRAIKVFLIHSDKRMTEWATMTKDLTTYQPFLNKMQIQQLVLQETLQKMNFVSLNENSFLSDLWFHATHVGSYLNVYYLFHSQTTIQQMFCYCMSFNGYLDNMRSVAEKLRLGLVHLAEFADDKNIDKENQNKYEKDEKDKKDEKDEKDEKLANRMTEFFYPLMAEDAENPDEIVKNSLCLENSILLTGPNASGKTTWIKSVALNFLFTQQVGVGFYDSCLLIKPYRHFHSYMNIPDTSERDSLFEAESRRCKHILSQLKSEQGAHLCIFDELFSGTNPQDATKAATSFLKYICQLPNCEDIDFVLTTHYVDVCRNLAVVATDSKGRSVTNYQMRSEEKDGQLKMFYECIPGISEIQGAIFVLEKMEFPQEILDGIENDS